MNPAEFHDRCEALKQRYPDQFVGMPLDMVGFSPGWTNIVERLCQSIDEVLEDEDRPNFHWVQIKEKYGGLRAYYVPRDAPQKKLIDALIKTAESESESTCEECGQPGTTVSVRKGWMRTLCIKHQNDALVRAMQTPEAKAATRALFNKTDAEFNRRRAALSAEFGYQFFELSDAMYQLPRGWIGIFERLCLAADAALEIPHHLTFSWTQVKEKFGRLICYYTGPRDMRIEQLLRSAEQESSRTCQECGEHGITLQTHGLVRTMCYRHHRGAGRQKQRSLDQKILGDVALDYGVTGSVWSIEQRNGQRVAVCRGTRKMACYQNQIDALKEEAEKLLSMPVEIIHLASRDPVLRDGLAALEETQGRYGPALAKLAMHVDGGRDHHTVSTLVAIDMKFIDLVAPFPASIGLARIDTSDTFYAEIAECLTDEIAVCSDFAMAHVKPLLKPETMVPVAQAADRLFAWLRDLPRPVVFITDGPPYDVAVLRGLLGQQRLQYIKLEAYGFDLYSAGKEHAWRLHNARMHYFNPERPQHHALHDALALREQVIEAIKLGWVL